MAGKYWLLQCNLVNQNQMERVRQAAIACGDEVASVRVTPFSGEVEYIDGEPPQDVIPYGSVSLIKTAIEKGWRGVFFNDQFRVAVWRCRPDMVNANPLIMRAHDVPFANLSEPFYFVRPNEDFKAFSGCVVDRARLWSWMSSAEHAGGAFHSDMLVCLSPPVQILGEWRWFVVDGVVVDGCMYMNHGQRVAEHETDPDALRQAQAMADVWLPHPTCVMDVAAYTDADGRERVGVLEFNGINATGFYAHNIPKIIQAISKAAP